MNRPTLIKKLAAANIEAVEITGAGRSLEVTIKDEDFENFKSHVANWGGYRCGTGDWVLKAAGHADKGDYCDKSSAWHY